MAETRDYNVIVFGASGFTGQFVAEELYRLQEEEGRSLKWAAAGRSEAKVRAALQRKFGTAQYHLIDPCLTILWLCL